MPCIACYLCQGMDQPVTIKQRDDHLRSHLKDSRFSSSSCDMCVVKWVKWHIGLGKVSMVFADVMVVMWLAGNEGREGAYSPSTIVVTNSQGTQAKVIATHLKLGTRLHLGVLDFLISCGDLKMKKGHQVNSPSSGLKVTYALPTGRIEVCSSLKHSWELCYKSLELHGTHWGHSQMLVSNRSIKILFQWKVLGQLSLYHLILFSSLLLFHWNKMSLIWFKFVILGTCGAASDGNFVKWRLRCRFWKLCTRVSNPGTRYPNWFHWLVWWYGARIVAPVMANGPQTLWRVCGSCNI